MTREQFYKTRAWKDIRTVALVRAGYKCNRCSNAGNYVHHIEYLTDSNYLDPDISLNLDNLEVLCLSCHNREHHGTDLRDGLMFDKNGNIIEIV